MWRRLGARCWQHSCPTSVARSLLQKSTGPSSDTRRRAAIGTLRQRSGRSCSAGRSSARPRAFGRRLQMTDRIACINPNCRRTAAQEKHPGSTWIICGKCYRAMPGRFRARWKALNKRSRRLPRISEKTKTTTTAARSRQWFRINRLYGRAWDRLNDDITQYFTASLQPLASRTS